MQNYNPIETWTREQCEEYLKQYPKSLKSEAVRKRMKDLGDGQKRAENEQEDEYWNLHCGSGKGIVGYLQKYPHGRHARECDDLLWELIIQRINDEKIPKLNKIENVRYYIKYFKKGKHIGECDDLLWNLIDKPSECSLYRKLFPQGKHSWECEPVFPNPASQPLSKLHQVNEQPEAHRESRKNELKAEQESRLNTRRFLKAGGIIICIIAAIAIVVAAINTGTEITITIVLVLLYPIYKLSTWDIEKNL